MVIKTTYIVYGIILYKFYWNQLFNIPFSWYNKIFYIEYTMDSFIIKTIYYLNIFYNIIKNRNLYNIYIILI